MTKTEIMLAASGSYGFRVHADDDYQTRRNCLWLLARGYVSHTVAWKELPEWDGQFLGYRYAQSVKIEKLHLTETGREYFTRGAVNKTC